MNQVSMCIDNIRKQLRNQLIVEGDHAYWEGYLSSSALSTALACIALAQRAHQLDQQQIHAGVHYLLVDQNKDGGWGDTENSPSNISTTLLAWACLKLCTADIPKGFQAIAHAETYIKEVIGSTEADAIVLHIQNKYGSDKTFAVPILMALCIAGCLGQRTDAWKHVPSLPFELAAFPQSLFAHLKLPVVSYALPALIAIGLVKHKQAPSKVLPIRWMRSGLELRCLRVLSKIQPKNGGFLEATPLTAFVAMALSQAQLGGHQVTKSSLGFLRDAQRVDGSWPIDTNLATWVTSLAVHALPNRDLAVHRSLITRWYQDQQFQEVHPYTGAAPGAWAWSPLPGAVPDADDTSGALRALIKLGCSDRSVYQSGLQWLFQLQNNDGGMPTFCKGWGTLPFDQSCVDISAHALSAFRACEAHVDADMRARLQRHSQRLIEYLIKQQAQDGSFSPLWFGNQQLSEHKNCVWGTARVVQGVRGYGSADELRKRAIAFLWSQQHNNGSWGGTRGSIEETGIVLEALAGEDKLSAAQKDSLKNATNYLCKQLESPVDPQPIGLYFASLWYSETMYPLCFALAGLRAYQQMGDRYD